MRCPQSSPIEWVPSLAADTLAYVAKLVSSPRLRLITVLVYGAATDGCDDDVRRLGAEWIEVSAHDRDSLLHRVRALVDGE